MSKTVVVGLTLMISLILINVNFVGTVSASNDALSEYYFEDFQVYNAGNNSVDNGWMEFNNTNLTVKTVRNAYGEIVDKKVEHTGDTGNKWFNLTHTYDYIIGSRVVVGIDDWRVGNSKVYKFRWSNSTNDNFQVVYFEIGALDDRVSILFTLRGGANNSYFQTTNYTRDDLINNSLLVKVDFTVLNDQEILLGGMIGGEVFSEIVDNGWDTGAGNFNITKFKLDGLQVGNNVSVHSFEVICSDDWYENVFLDANGLLKYLGTDHESPKHRWSDESTGKFRVMRSGGSTTYYNVMRNSYEYDVGFNGYVEEFRVLLCGFQETAQGTDPMNNYHFKELKLSVRAPDATTVPENGKTVGSPIVQRVSGKTQSASGVSGGMIPVYEVSWTDIDFRIEGAGGGEITFDVFWPYDTFIVSGISFSVYGLYCTDHLDWDVDGDRKTGLFYGQLNVGGSFNNRGYTPRDCLYHFGWNDLETTENNVVSAFSNKNAYVEGDPCLFDWQRTAGNTDWSFGVQDGGSNWVYVKSYAYGTNNQDTNTISGNIPFGYDTTAPWKLVWRNRLASSWTTAKTFTVAASAATYICNPIDDYVAVGRNVYINVMAPAAEQVNISILKARTSGYLQIDEISYVGTGGLENITIGIFQESGGYAVQMFKASGAHATNRMPFSIGDSYVPPGGVFSVKSDKTKYYTGESVILYGNNPHMWQEIVVVGKHTREERILNCSNGPYDVYFGWEADDVWQVHTLNGDKKSVNPLYIFYVGEQYWPATADDEVSDADVALVIGLVLMLGAGAMFGMLSESGTGAAVGAFGMGCFLAVQEQPWTMLPEQLLFLFGFAMVLLFMSMIFGKG